VLHRLPVLDRAQEVHERYGVLAQAMRRLEGFLGADDDTVALVGDQPLGRVSPVPQAEGVSCVFR
jgi:hypothetical protein